MHAEALLDTQELVRRWRALTADPAAPEFCEINERGEILVNPPPTPRHQRIGRAVLDALERQLGPEALYDVAVVTDRGVRVPDVVWMPPVRWADVDYTTALKSVPDVCVEILSPGNSRDEIAEKTGAYLRGGAREVVVIGLQGEIEFHGADGRRATSALGLVFELSPDLFA